MVRRRIAIKEQRTLSPDKNCTPPNILHGIVEGRLVTVGKILVGEKIVRTGNSFLLTVLLTKQTKFCVLRKGPNEQGSATVEQKN